MKMVVNNNLVNAAKKKYEAQIEEALATLHIYFTNAVGIGEHPDLLNEVDKYAVSYTHLTLPTNSSV